MAKIKKQTKKARKKRKVARKRLKLSGAKSLKRAKLMSQRINQGHRMLHMPRERKLRKFTPTRLSKVHDKYKTVIAK
jgi:hypothetical protein